MPSLKELYESPAQRVARLRALTVDPEQDEQELNRSGAIGSLFKFLGRTSGASAEAAFAATDKDPNTTVLGGIKEGLSGRADVSYKDVLQQNLGVKNGPLAAIAGFGLDVVADPLTYIGAKKLKGISEPEAVLQAIKSGSDDIASDSARLMAASPTRVGLTVSGKPFGNGKVIGSVGLPRTGLTEKLLGPVTDRRLVPKLASRSAEFPMGLNEMGRVIDNSHNAAYTNFRHQMLSMYDGLTKDERSTIAHAMDSGEPMTHTPVMDPGKTKYKTLGEYVQASRRMTDQFFVDEAQLGLFTAKPGSVGKSVEDFEGYNPNYIYRYYQKPPVDALAEGTVNLPNKLAGSERAGFQKRRTADISLAEAKELGWDPLTDIGDIMDMRAGKHYRSMAAGAQMRDAIDQFSISAEDLAKLGNQSQVKALGWVEANKMAGPVAAKYDGRYVPSFVYKTMNQAWDTYKGETTGAQAMKLHDKIMRNWKFGNTSLMPAYHVRASMGDLMQNMADGVTNPQRYQQAFKIINDRKAINERTLAEMAGGDIQNLIEPVSNKTVRLGGQKVATDRVFDLYNQSGAKSGLITSEIQRSMSDFERKSLGKSLSIFKSKVGDWSDTREDFFRLAHFIDATDDIIKKGKGKIGLEEASMEAGKRVRKFNIDYGDTSSFERSTLNRVIPFYTWMRKSTPLNMELLFTKPGFMAVYPKGQDMLQGILGTDSAEGEQLIPDWIREMAPVRLALGKAEDRNWFQNAIAGVTGLGENEPGFLNFAGDVGGLAPVGSLAAPLDVAGGISRGSPQDTLQALVNPLQQGLTPLLKAPIEAGTGRSLFNGQDLNFNSWLLSQAGGVGRTADANSGIGQALLGGLTGVSVQRATGARQEGEFMRRQDVASEKKRSVKTDLLKKRFPDWDNFTEAKQESLRGAAQMTKGPEDIRALRQRRYLTQILGQ